MIPSYIKYLFYIKKTQKKPYPSTIKKYSRKQKKKIISEEYDRKNNFLGLNNLENIIYFIELYLFFFDSTETYINVL